MGVRPLRTATLAVVSLLSVGLADAALRTLATEASSSSLPSDASFVFDGNSSDIAQQLYVRHTAGDTADSIELAVVPTAVANRLDPLSIDFNTLPGLVQRALLWDTGFALAPGGEAVQMWTLDGYSMAELAIPQEDVIAAQCTFINCTQPDDVTVYYSRACRGDNMTSVSRCVVDEFDDPGAVSYAGMMWSNGGDPDMAPLIRLRNHAWTESYGASFSVYVVHTTSAEDDPAWGTCPSGYASLSVPCHRRDNITDAMAAALSTPTGSAWVTTWLEQYDESGSGFDLLLLIPIILGAVLVLVLVGVGWFCWRRRAKQRADKSSGANCAFDEGSPVYVGGQGTPDQAQRYTISTSHPTTNGTSSSNTTGEYVSAGSNKTLKTLLGSQYLAGKRIPFESLVFEKALSKGASGEVWVCEYAGQKVAVKRLLQTKEQKAEDVQAFAEEIDLSASLQHPHIVAFIGVAWNSLNNLVLVLEFFPMGNLQTYLQKNSDLLSWARDKIHMAVGVAQALEYLHLRNPPLIHRDLKSNNILLTSKLEAKLIDFGVSRGLKENTMTAGVGTPYWTAPEILEGKRYTEQADIYSFGVVLSELDTCKIPYSDAMTTNGKKPKPFQILQDVMSGTLRPSFSSDCPPRIQRVGTACLDHDPARRPTATQLIQELEG
ncbi:hypothetical protein BBJ28_00025460 [Nothophytophthora sp. Chile5]|nr:hypothetical protein BBJ28_00025460 [Nothophytophthora sp. Chile5]